MNNIAEQWLLNGDCSICRRREYCSKPCKKGRQRANAEMAEIVAKKLSSRTILEALKTDSSQEGAHLRNGKSKMA